MNATVRKSLITCLLLSSSVCFAEPAKQGDFWQTPTIAGFGKMHYLADSAFKPDVSKQYHIVFGLTAHAEAPNLVNQALDRVARTVNLYVAAGVPLRHLHIVAVAYAQATPLVLNNQAYKNKYGTDNPNLALIARLKKAGVTISVCGQAIAEQHFDYKDIDPDVTLSLSALTTITSLQQQGYALMPL